MKSIVAALLVLGACAGAADAQPIRPKLVVALSVDHLSAELFDEYRSHFTGGLKRLSNGVVFANAFQAHGPTETCPGHSTILTGSHPARTGIIANQWVDWNAARPDKTIYCAEDHRIADSSSTRYTVSDLQIRVSTLGDWMRQANPASRVVAVAGKDRSAVMMGAHNPDQRWWWGGDRFVQNGAAPAPVGAQVNAAISRAIGEARPPLVPPAFCAPKDRAIDIGGGKSVGTFRFARNAGDASAFTMSPEMDAATLAMAAALIEQMQLGRGAAPDLLAISLSATDLVGHRYGTDGVEMCLQLMSLDSDLAGFFTLLDRSGIEYAVVVTADHGGLDLPERRRAVNGVATARVDRAATVEAISTEVTRKLGLAGPAFVGQWYISGTVPVARRTEVLALTRHLLAAQPQVEATFSAAEITAHPMPQGHPESWSVLDRLRASFDPQRSPSLVVVYKPGITPIPAPVEDHVSTHGSVWDYDRKVPILFWWKGVTGQDHEESAMTIDIAPTLASLIGVTTPQSAIDGHCLDLLPGPENNCP